MKLLDHSKNVYSQSGEDGILEKVLDTIGSRDKWCVEFGAWDGEHLSNTANLIQNSGYSAVLIEGSSERHKILSKRYASNQKVTALNCFVGFNSSDSLDKILAEIRIPTNFDLLSIDIDGNDFYVWEAVSSYFPKVVCIEYNLTIPTEVDFVQPANPAINQGASLLALVRLGSRKGYELVAVTKNNGIFVRSEFFPLFGITDNSPRALREDVSCVTYVFCGFDGTVFFSGDGRILWHGIKYSGRIRRLPKFFQSFPENYGPLKLKLLNLYKKLLELLGRG